MSVFDNISSSNPQALPRKLTAVGTVGEVGQLFTVYEKNWNCTDCGQENYAQRPRCFRCKKQKPASTNNYVVDPALQALQAGKEIEWQEAVDPNTYQIYYYNKVTGVSQWDRPVELGPAPTATGWFGRGKSGSLGTNMYAELNKFYLSRPARKQKEYIDPKKYHLEGAQEYNIWYGRYIGDLSDKMDREPAADRCKLETDAGYTKADLVNNKTDKKNKRFFCIHFARGVCAKGSECTYYHRVPLPEDDARCDELFDCFGRQRHNKHKDDMSGVGSFMKPCRTLFIGNLLKAKYESPQALEDALWRHFGEFGEVESLNVIHRLSIAFPRYRLRTSAEFAKEAMHCQKLDYDEILSIRWAHDDPNPVAKDSIERADKDAMFALLQAKGISLKPAEFEYPADYQLPDAKRLKVEEGGEIVAENPQIAYPDTDNQYQETTTTSFDPNAFTAILQQSTSSSTHQPMSLVAAADETVTKAQQNALSQLGLLMDYGDDEDEEEKDEGEGAKEEAPTTSQEGEDEEAAEEDTEEGAGGWCQYIDEATGAAYYFNSTTGESSWTPPTFDNEQTAAATTTSDATAAST